ncbi:MAG TPA: PilZ domain-containing protein [Terriglobales bacterium]|nr:PilZ domain-containing protein [Terriglobales bacterium]
MELNALLMCREQESLRTLVGALDEYGIDEEVCASEPEAMQLLALGYYSALIVDFDLPGAAQVVRMAHLAPAKRRPVVFALIGALTDVGSTFQAGANFVLYKPLEKDQLERSLRAGQAFMRPDRRKSRREKTESLVYLRFGDVCPVPALVLEISQDGLSVQASEPLPAAELPLRFILPGTSYMIEGSGEVTWADDSGRGGIFFSQLSASARRQLKAWLAKRDKKKPSRVRAAARAAKARLVAAPAN